MPEVNHLKTNLDELPAPDAEAKRRSAELRQVIRQRCDENHGKIPFSEYMQTALYEPGLGYYAGGSQKFGESGDFITAPEVSPMFSQCLARQYAQVLSMMSDPVVLEFGGGSGVMAAQSLLELAKIDSLPSHYYIVELSAELKLRQRETIGKIAPDLLERVDWIDVLPDASFEGVIVANEVLDAMPVECFMIEDGRVHSLYVSAGDDGIESSYQVADGSVESSVREIEQRLGRVMSDGYRSEFNPNLSGWIRSLSGILDRGMILLVDYGYPMQEYYHPEREMGTLICHYQHRATADPFWYPGLQDITSFVDFTAIAYAAEESGLDVSGFSSQAAFLMASGLESYHQRLMSDDVKVQIKLSQQIKTLTLPSEMGERFKFIALTRDFDEPLLGFAMQDLRNRL